MRTEFLCISVLRVASGPRLKLADCKSAFTPSPFTPPPPPPPPHAPTRNHTHTLVWFCLLPGIWEGLRFIMVALPGLFSYFLFLLKQWWRQDGLLTSSIRSTRQEANWFCYSYFLNKDKYRLDSGHQARGKQILLPILLKQWWRQFGFKTSLIRSSKKEASRFCYS